MEQINFGEFQYKLLEIMADLLQNNDSTSKEEEHIITSALVLWTTILKLRSGLVDEFFSWTRPIGPAEEGEPGPIKNATDFVICGIYSPKSKIVRTEFKDSLELICQKVQSTKT